MTDDEQQLWKLQQRDLIQVGNSLAVTIHKDEREKLDLGRDDQLTVKIFENGEIVLTPNSE